MTQETQKPKNNKRTRIILFAALFAVVGGAAYAANQFMHIGGKKVETNDAYTGAEIAQVTANTSGIVKRVNVSDTQMVRAGDELVILDDTDAQLALKEALAQLSGAQQKHTGAVATDKQQSALVNARAADEGAAKAKMQQAQADFETAQTNLARRNALSGTGAVSQDEITQAQHAFDLAKANIEAAKASLNQANANRLAAIGSKEANAAQLSNGSNTPEVELARAKVDQARVNLERTIIRAPIGGIIAKRQIQLGQLLQAGTPIMSVVPTEEVYIDANFKESQLKSVKIGQKAEIHADIYGKDVVFHGTVAGFSGGTGSAFSLIPAQNASGNWIKVVQRLPVRIKLDAQELKEHPLKVGLSMNVKVITGGK
jgi:membrane fusion protein, multidrug efflux system